MHDAERKTCLCFIVRFLLLNLIIGNVLNDASVMTSWNSQVVIVCAGLMKLVDFIFLCPVFFVDFDVSLFQ